MRSLLTTVLSLTIATVSVPASAAGIVNWDFEGGWTAMAPNPPGIDLGADNVPNSWSRVETFTGILPGGGTAPETSVITVVADNGLSAAGGNALQCTRQEGQQGASSGDWTAVQQNVSIDATQCAALSLQIDTKVIAHNLEAGGWVAPAFEWPVVLEIEYTKQGGGSQIWRYGWYLDPPGDVVFGQVNDPGQGLIGTYNDMVVPQNQWVTTTFDLFNELPQLATVDRIRVGGSGWNFEGRADNLIIKCAPIPEPATAALLLLALGGVAGRLRHRLR
jgi:hypothetical protein